MLSALAYLAMVYTYNLCKQLDKLLCFINSECTADVLAFASRHLLDAKFQVQPSTVKANLL